MMNRARRFRWAGGALLLAAAALTLVFASGGSETGASRRVAAGEAASWPSITLTRVITGFSEPVHVTHAGDGSGRLFVVEKHGRIRVFLDGEATPTSFLSIPERVGSEGSEQGLLSVAFPTDYEQKGYFYVDYTDVDGDTVVARYRVSDDPDVADPDSERIILTQTQPYANHNGGQLAFGPDGYLYVGLGDGGSGGDPHGNAQDPSSWLGKLLRIDVALGPAPGPGFTATEQVYLPLVVGGADVRYRIPSSNPYTETVGYRPEIWALGLRNPWRFSFDRSTGDLLIGDVGQAAYEEIDFQPSSSDGGENYGWNIMEGAHCYPDPPCDQLGLVLPVAEYEHTGGNCSVTGGMVYRGSGNPAMEGIYFYADYCSGRIWGLVREEGAWETELLLETGLTITSFGEDEEGNLYVADFGRGEIYLVTEVQ